VSPSKFVKHKAGFTNMGNYLTTVQTMLYPDLNITVVIILADRSLDIYLQTMKFWNYIFGIKFITVAPREGYHVKASKPNDPGWREWGFISWLMGNKLSCASLMASTLRLSSSMGCSRPVYVSEVLTTVLPIWIFRQQTVTACFTINIPSLNPARCR
ncbi:hypothetical protein L9F63_020198, partial [Diploptera punctata]